MPLRDSERPVFGQLVTKVYAFYRADISDFALDVWWSAMMPFDLAAIKDAFNRHAVNPDAGQFLPKPADVVRMLSGSSSDSALSAWSKVERAVRHVGIYPSVVFDDALIHRVITDMGGWLKLCSCPTEKDFEFVGKDFVTRYRGFVMRSEFPEYPPVLIGQAEAANSEQGRKSQPPTAIGNQDACLKVYRGGSDGAGVSAQPLRLTDGGLKLITSTSGTDAA